MGNFGKLSEYPNEMPHRVAFHQDLHCLLRLKRYSWTEVQDNLGLVATKPVFGYSDKERLKPVPSATETS